MPEDFACLDRVKTRPRQPGCVRVPQVMQSAVDVDAAGDAAERFGEPLRVDRLAVATVADGACRTACARRCSRSRATAYFGSGIVRRPMSLFVALGL